ncbi:uncharacterized protein LOC143179685 [Calliopsis andreniformis]|uniref:uncharacterized protein LOC143179685 n=1 Tax=Calliopsis andreniformis TaxID=337506 RepID=UPI003FCE8918
MKSDMYVMKEISTFVEPTSRQRKILQVFGNNRKRTRILRKSAHTDSPVCYRVCEREKGKESINKVFIQVLPTDGKQAILVAELLIRLKSMLIQTVLPTKRIDR